MNKFALNWKKEN